MQPSRTSRGGARQRGVSLHPGVKTYIHTAVHPSSFMPKSRAVGNFFVVAESRSRPIPGSLNGNLCDNAAHRLPQHTIAPAYYCDNAALRLCSSPTTPITQCRNNTAELKRKYEACIRAKRVAAIRKAKAKRAKRKAKKKAKKASLELPTAAT